MTREEIVDDLQRLDGGDATIALAMDKLRYLCAKHSVTYHEVFGSKKMNGSLMYLTTITDGIARIKNLCTGDEVLVDIT